MAQREWDIVVFGASGYTGQHVLEQVAETAAQEKGLRWAIAGRNRAKLIATLEDSSHYEPSLRDQRLGVGILEATLENSDSLLKMTASTRVLLNCVGPYSQYGEAILLACLETGTHLLDITGENVFMERIQVEFFDKARAAQIYVISACGFGFLPMDLGVEFLRDNFGGGTLNSVECFFNINLGPGGVVLHTGTWDSMVSNFTYKSKLNTVRERFKQKFIEPLKNKLPGNFGQWSPFRKWPMFCDRHAGGMCVTMPGSWKQPDAHVVDRTQWLGLQDFGSRPVLYESSVKLSYTARQLIQFSLITINVGFWSLFGSCGLNMLLRHPRFFSGCAVSTSGPTREQLSKTRFELIFVGKGWREAQDENSIPTRPNKEVVGKISGKDPAYRTTAACLVQAGVALLRALDKGADGGLPAGGGGVYTPAAALARTDIATRLNRYGITFQLL